MPSLVLIKSPGGQTPGPPVPLDREVTVLGRDESGCQLVIPHHAVSRRHAQITRVGGRFLLEDLGSRNRTYLNNAEVKSRTQLRPNDLIRICDFVYRYLDPRPAEPVSNAADPRPAGGMIAGAQPVPDYMAPEQINERADTPPSPATDLHAVGVMLFQVLTGELPFAPGLRDGAKLDAIVKRRFASAVEWCQAKGVPSRTAPVIDQLLRGGVYRLSLIHI